MFGRNDDDGYEGFGDFGAYGDIDAGFWLEPDFLLQNLVATFINVSGLQLGVTLFVKGAVISGLMVSEREYLARVTDVFRSMSRDALPDLPKEDRKQLDEALDFSMLAETPSLEQTESEDFDPEDFDITTVRFVHLIDVITISSIPPIQFGRSAMLPILRLRLSQIDGWILGQATGLDGFGSDDRGNSNGNGRPDILH